MAKSYFNGLQKFVFIFGVSVFFTWAAEAQWAPDFATGTEKTPVEKNAPKKASSKKKRSTANSELVPTSEVSSATQLPVKKVAKEKKSKKKNDLNQAAQPDGMAAQTSSLTNEPAKKEIAKIEVAQQASPAVPSSADILKQKWEDEGEAVRAKNNLEKEVIAATASYEQKMKQLANESDKKRKRIEDLQRSQYESAKHIEDLKVEIEHAEVRFKALDSTAKNLEEKQLVLNQKFSEATEELKRSRSQLAETNSKNEQTRQQTVSSIYKLQIDMQKARSEVAANEAEISRLDVEIKKQENEEAQTQVKWAKLSRQLTALKNEKEQVSFSYEKTKERTLESSNQYKNTKTEYDAVAKEIASLQEKYLRQKNEMLSEIKRAETETIVLSNQKTLLDEERTKYQFETEQMRKTLNQAQDRLARVRDQNVTSQQAMMDARLENETIKATLVAAESREEKQKVDFDRKIVQARSLATVSDSIEVGEGLFPWVASKKCKITRKPNSDESEVGSINAGDRLVASHDQSGFVKILGSSGRVNFVSSACGSYIK